MQALRGQRLTPTHLAVQNDTVSKAVVYQWESQKRKQSPVFCNRTDSVAVPTKVANHTLGVGNRID